MSEGLLGNRRRNWMVFSRTLCALGASMLALVTSDVGAVRFHAAAGNMGQFADIQISEMVDIVSDYRYQTVFGGLAGDPNTGVVTIFLAPTAQQTKSAAARAALSAVGTASDPDLGYLPKKWTVQYQTVGPSLAVLNQVASSVDSAQPWRNDVGKGLISYGIDPVRHVVDVGVEEITPTLASDSAAAFGNLVHLQVVSRPLLMDDCITYSPTPPRCLDRQPYYGGDRIADTSQNYCSGGFTTWDPSAGGDYGMLTAGHCWPVGTSVLQGYVDSLHYVPPYPTIRSGTMGRVTRQVFGNYLSDAEFLDSTATGTAVAGRVYTTLDGPANASVSTYGSSFVGMSVCFDGSVTGENCTAVVQAPIQQCIIPPPATFHVCHVTLASSSNSTVICQSGDSGGPVYTHSGSITVVAYGLIEAGVQPNANTSCYYSEITQSLAELGVGLVTTSGNLPPPTNLGNTLWPNQQMTGPNQYIGSCDVQSSCTNQYVAIMQGDGNFVVYLQTGSGSIPQWSTNTSNHPGDYLIMQGDGNLVLYRQGGGISDWNSGTQNNPGACLIMQGDGNLVIYTQGNGAVCGQYATPLWWTRH